MTMLTICRPDEDCALEKAVDFLARCPESEQKNHIRLNVRAHPHPWGLGSIAISKAEHHCDEKQWGPQ